MDLSLKKNFVINAEIPNYPDDENEFEDSLQNIFIPDEQPLDLTVKRKCDQFKEDIENLQSFNESHRKLFEEILPHLTFLLKENFKNPKSQEISAQKPPIARGLINKNLGIKVKQKKRKRSCSNDSDYHTEESFDGEMNRQCKDILTIPEQSKPLEGGGGSLVQIGSKGTCIACEKFDQIRWDSPGAATRHLLTVIFGFETLATHSLTGKPSPAFFGRERPLKNPLDENKVSDIIECVCSKFPEATIREIRSVITMKCADAAKRKQSRNKKLKLESKEETSN